MVISAAMAGLALVLPVAFHMTGLGSKFLPMLLPLLLNGFFVAVPWALLTGAVTPLVSSLATGMPPLYPPVALSMSVEGAVLGGVAAALFRGNPKRLWIALPAAVALGRLSTLATTFLLARLFDLPPGFASAAVLVQGLPGVALQLAAVPLAVSALSRRHGILFVHEPQSEA